MSNSSPPTLPAFLQSSRDEIQSKFGDLEWNQRNMLAEASQDTDSTSQWIRPSGDEVLRRNRYANIDPYENNRVKLRVADGADDYINASPIALKGSKDGELYRFIATQGPVPNSLAHFWRMVWHETGPEAVIVMLTQTHEAGREKCLQYYPLAIDDPILTFKDPVDDFEGTVELQDISQDLKTRSEVRKLVLKVDGNEKVVWHYLFVGWPDFLVPEDEDRLALIELTKLSAKKAAESANDVGSNPRIIHCSAGVGRSGTFIALDYLLDQLDRGILDHMSDDEDVIVDTVDRLRQQRMMMVQGMSQFQFLYTVLKEKWLQRHDQSEEASS